MFGKFGRALSTCALLVAAGCTGPAADPQQHPAAQGAGTAPPANVSATGPGSVAVAGPADLILSNGKVIEEIKSVISMVGGRVVYAAAAPVTTTAAR
jgi:hypothetical protein